MDLAFFVPTLMVAALAGFGALFMVMIISALRRTPSVRLEQRPLMRLLSTEALLMLLLAAFSLMLILPSDQWPEWAQWVVVPVGIILLLCLIVNPLLYLYFLSTLPSPLTKPLRKKRGFAAAVAAMVASVLLIDFVVRHFGGANDRWEEYLTAAWFVALPTYGLLVALSMWRSAAQGSEERRRGFWYAVAFGTRDAAAILFFILLAAGVADQPDPWPMLVFALLPGGVVAFGLLMVHGINKTGLFGVDPSFVRTGALMLAFMLIVYVGAEILKKFLATHWDPYAAVAVAGLLPFGLRGIEKWTKKRTRQAPSEDGDLGGEFRTFRDCSVYHDAAKAAAEDGRIGEDERRMLDCLRLSLGIPPTMAQAIEQDALAAQARAAGAPLASPAPGDADAAPQPL